MAVTCPADEEEAVLLDIAAEALRADGVLLSVHLLAANDRCAAQVSSQRVRNTRKRDGL
jgi:hypothetical protein